MLGCLSKLCFALKTFHSDSTVYESVFFGGGFFVLRYILKYCMKTYRKLSDVFPKYRSYLNHSLHEFTIADSVTKVISLMWMVKGCRAQRGCSYFYHQFINLYHILYYGKAVGVSELHQEANWSISLCSLQVIPLCYGFYFH